jgi:hypothetical protein
LPKTELSSRRIKRFHERYQWLLGLTVCAVIGGMFLPEPAGSRTSDYECIGLCGTAQALALILLSFYRFRLGPPRRALKIMPPANTKRRCTNTSGC